MWWLLIILLITAAVLFFVRQQGRSNRGKSAIEILKERYAKGEISKEKFEEMKRDIL